MRWFLPVVLMLTLMAACSAPTQTTAPSPTVDVAATVNAAVEATRAVDRSVQATVEAQAEATRAANPTATPFPTATPVVMTEFVSTPEPFIVAPGEIEESLDRFLDCFHGDPGFRAVLLTGMGTGLAGSGLTAEEIESLGWEELFSDRESFLSSAESDPDFAVMLAAMGEIIDEFCVQGPSGPAGAVDHPVVAPGEFLESMAGLYDGMQENETLWAIFLLGFRSELTAEGVSPVVVDALAETIMQDWEVFLEFVRLGVEQDLGQVSDVAFLDEFVAVFCGGSPGPGHDLGMTDSKARALLGELFDCAVSREDGIRRAFMSGFGEPYAAEIFEALISDRESFVEFMLALVRLDPEAAFRFAELEKLLDDGCR